MDSVLVRSTYYDAIMSNDTIKINKTLRSLNNDAFESKDAFKGALLMKKSQYKTKAADKLAVFKEGKALLENSISQSNSLQVEKRFLRLMIQENCPAIVNYKKNINEDASFIEKNFSSLDAYTQSVVTKYASHSTALKNKKFN